MLASGQGKKKARSLSHYGDGFFSYTAWSTQKYERQKSSIMGMKL